VRQWTLFQPIMHDKVWLQANLEDLRKSRNDLAHGVQPPVDEKIRIAFLASEIGKRLPLQPDPPQTVEAPGSVRHLVGRSILWADDHPEGNSWSRRILTRFGAEVVPVLANDEAVAHVIRRLRCYRDAAEYSVRELTRRWSITVTRSQRISEAAVGELPLNEGNRTPECHPQTDPRSCPSST
jgi:hypothetical protein